MKTNSIYSINKNNPDAIIYIDSKGNETRLTEKDFSSKEEFSHWKEWSDENYHEAEKAQHLYDDHTISIELLSDEALCVPSIEEALAEEDNEFEHRTVCAQLLMKVQSSMTPRQFRRAMMYYGEKMTEDEIASAEKVSQQKISKSINAGINRARGIDRNDCK